MATSNQIQSHALALNFDFGSYPIRVTGTYEDPWFVASDVCECLGISNSRDAVSKLDEDEKGVASTDTLGGVQETLIVNESGLYGLIFASRKPEAKEFKRWVRKEVLPSIRLTGGYVKNFDKFMSHRMFGDLKQQALEHVTNQYYLIFKHHVTRLVRDELVSGEVALGEKILSHIQKIWFSYYPNSDGVPVPLPMSKRKAQPSMYVKKGRPVAELTAQWKMMYKHVTNPPESLEDFLARNGDQPNQDDWQ